MKREDERSILRHPTYGTVSGQECENRRQHVAQNEYIMTNVCGRRERNCTSAHRVLDVAYAHAARFIPTCKKRRAGLPKKRDCRCQIFWQCPEDGLFIYQTTTKIGRANRCPARVSREPRASPPDHLTANQV